MSDDFDLCNFDPIEKQPHEPQSSTSFDLTWDDLTYFIENNAKLRVEQREKYVRLFSTTCAKVRHTFRALNLSKSNDMPAPVNNVTKTRIKLATHRNGLYVFVKQGGLWSADTSFWFISAELLCAGQDKRNKLCEESGKLSFQYQGLRKKHNLLDVKTEHIKDLEETLRTENIWCVEVSKLIEAKLQTIEDERKQLRAEMDEITNKMDIYTYDGDLPPSEVVDD
jgi:hypothetical protein